MNGIASSPENVKIVNPLTQIPTSLLDPEGKNVPTKFIMTLDHVVDKKVESSTIWNRGLSSSTTISSMSLPSNSNPVEKRPSPTPEKLKEKETKMAQLRSYLLGLAGSEEEATELVKEYLRDPQVGPVPFRNHLVLFDGHPEQYAFSGNPTPQPSYIPQFRL